MVEAFEMVLVVKNKKGEVMKKGISIHIGLEYFNPKEYEGQRGVLPTCKQDMLEMQKIAKNQKFTSSQLLLNEKATRDNVVSVITLASQELHKGDMLFISYSGHGTYFEDKTKGRDEKEDESWCLYDGFLLDDELHYFWTLFNEGVRIFMISDSCHSGTMAKYIVNENTPIEESFSKDTAKNLYLKRKKYYDEIKQRANRAKEKEIKATVMFIAGCQDNESSYIFPPDKNSLLTLVLNKVWNDGEFEGTTKEFFEAIKKRVRDIAKKKRKYQTPNLYVIGKENRAFQNQKPFSI